VKGIPAAPALVAVVLLLLGGAGAAFWIGGKDNAAIAARTSSAPPAEIAKAPPSTPVQATRGLKLPPRPPPAEVVPEVAPPPPPAPAPPPPSEVSASAPPPAPPEKPTPSKTACVADIGAWPTDKTDQGKAIQSLLRDLGFYSGTVYGTVGPTTRAAIRKFQLSVEQAETGEPDEALFESLKTKKCASSVP
jgi:hypothetical protein